MRSISINEIYIVTTKVFFYDVASIEIEIDDVDFDFDFNNVDFNNLNPILFNDVYRFL
jgi:hypothetical protein